VTGNVNPQTERPIDLGEDDPEIGIILTLMRSWQMKAVRRLGKNPAELGTTSGVSGSPDILELDDGAFAAIGVDITDQVDDLLQLGASCAPNERVVRIPRVTLVAAKHDIPED
jgi:hypothetical protein